VDSHKLSMAESSIEGFGKAFECCDRGRGQGVGQLDGLPYDHYCSREGNIGGIREFMRLVLAKSGEDDGAAKRLAHTNDLEAKITYGIRSQNAEMTINLFRIDICRPHTSSIGKISRAVSVTTSSAVITCHLVSFCGHSELAESIDHAKSRRKEQPAVRRAIDTMHWTTIRPPAPY
jgi:hypothetical protein